MAKMSEYAFVAAMLSTGLATIFYFMYAVSGLRAARMQTAGATMTTGSSLHPRSIASCCARRARQSRPNDRIVYFALPAGARQWRSPQRKSSMAG